MTVPQPGRSPAGRGRDGELPGVGRERPELQRTDLARQQGVEEADVEDGGQRRREREGQEPEQSHQRQIEDDIEAIEAKLANIGVFASL